MMTAVRLWNQGISVIIPARSLRRTCEEAQRRMYEWVQHGVLRRALLFYSAPAMKLRGNPSNVPPDALQKTVNLFKALGEEYHEKKLEEAFIFPAVKKGAVRLRL